MWLRSYRSGFPKTVIQCNQCSFVCPHAAIRAKLIDKGNLKDAPASFKTLKAMGKDGDKYDYKVQVYIEDCQSCWNCVNVCPKEALVMKPIADERELGEVENQKFFTSLPEDVMSTMVKEGSVKGSQFKQPLLEFSGACAGCGETPYVKLITQLYGDRMIVANATGCSSIWGGTFPTVPYCKNKDGHGPTWANSLFEDNAEYGFGMRLAVDANRKQLKNLIDLVLEAGVDVDFAALLNKQKELWKSTEEEAKANAKAIRGMLPAQFEKADGDKKELLRRMTELQSYFIEKSVWCFGGDGWAYDIGYGGLDTTSSHPARTSTCSCWTPKSIRTPVVRRPKQPRWAPSPSSPNRAKRRSRRTSV